MALKNLYQTNWRIEPGKVMIYPHRIAILLGIFLAVVFAALMVFATYITLPK
jgi:hypothetical protein